MKEVIVETPVFAREVGDKPGGRAPDKQQAFYGQMDEEAYWGSTWENDPYRFQRAYQLLESERPGILCGIGVFNGQELQPLLEKGWDCHGIELSKASELAIRRGIKCIQHDVSEGIPFDGEFFDAIWAIEVIEHLFDTDLFLDQCHRVLRKRGVIVLSTPNLASLINRVKLLLGMYPRYVAFSDDSSMLQCHHIRYYTARVLRYQLRKHGFRVERIVGNFLSCPDPTPGKVVRRFVLSPLGRVFPTLAENLVVRARKL